jgi:hypothetical protein
MAKSDSDQAVLSAITKLVHEEEKLHSEQPQSDHATGRLEEIRVELDQCWDLLRQRRALREFGKDPDKAKVRPASVVEKYEQ